MDEALKCRRARWRVPVLVIVALALLVARERLMFSADLWLVCRSDIPSPATLHELLRREPASERVVRALWQTGKIPHRAAAVAFVKSRAARHPDFVRGLEDLLREAVVDPDQSVRKHALTTLSAAGSPLASDVARWFLTQGDTGLIMEGLFRLRRDRATNQVAEIAALLDHPVAATAVMAGFTLATLTGQDLGLESGMGRRVAGMSAEAWAARQTRTEQALERVRNWWGKEAANWPATVGDPARLFVPAQRALPPLGFVTAAMEPVSTAALCGRPTLLFFFVTFCGTCQQMLPEMPALRSALTDKVELLAVSLDAVPDDHNHFIELNMAEEEHDHHGHDHHHHASHHTPAEVVAASAKVVRGLAPALSPLFDVRGHATGMLDAGEVPVMIVLDAEGRLVRRLTAGRSNEELMALLQHLFPAQFGGNNPG